MRRGLWIRLGVLVAIGLISIGLVFFTPLGAYLEPTRLYDLLTRIRESPWAPVAFVLGFVAFSLLGAPLMPVMIAGGAVFGFLRGFALTYIGTLLATSACYGAARWLGQEAVRQLLGSRFLALEKLLDHAGFWTMVRLRFIPIPFPIFNYGSALVGVPFARYAGSTAIAFAPIIAVYSYFAATLVSVGEADRGVILRNLTIASLAMIALTFLPGWIIAWRKRGASSETTPGDEVS